MTPSTKRTILRLFIFSVAMGYLESAVVIYLREIYYPQGFAFPLKPISGHIAVVELFREFATLLMLAGVGSMAGRRNIERFAMFIFSFAIWDIFYYIFLKIMVDWPTSLFTWDILFLIPVTWVGPVIAPVINSLTMIILAFVIIHAVDKHDSAKVNATDWVLLLLGSAIIIISYIEGYLRFMLKTFQLSELIEPSMSRQVLAMATTYVPDTFKWWIFFTGQGLIIIGIVMISLRQKS